MGGEGEEDKQGNDQRPIKYTYYEYFLLPVAFSTASFNKQKFYILIKSNFSFCVCGLCFFVFSKKFLSRPWVQNFSPIFSLRGFIALAFAFIVWLLH